MLAGATCFLELPYTTQSQQPQQQQHQTQIAFDAGLNLSDDEETVPINKALDK